MLPTKISILYLCHRKLYNRTDPTKRQFWKLATKPEQSRTRIVQQYTTFEESLFDVFIGRWFAWRDGEKALPPALLSSSSLRNGADNTRYQQAVGWPARRELVSCATNVDVKTTNDCAAVRGAATFSLMCVKSL